MAAKDHVDIWLFLATMVGTSLVIASACVFNNYIDRGIDVVMTRTRRRALVTGKISKSSALVYGLILGVLGFAIVLVYTNALVAWIGLVGFIDYIVLYGASKRRSVYGTLVGSISGSTPIVAGYAAVTGNLDTAALLLFLIMVFWQMAHFYGIALYRAADYKAAGIPVLPVARSYVEAKTQIQIYIILFMGGVVLLTSLGYTGYTFLAVMLVSGIMWLLRSWRPVSAQTSAVWGKQIFLFSLVVILALSVMLAVGGRSSLLP